MSRWIAMHCCEETDRLQEFYPNAYLLLCQIARRARWQDCDITGLRIGEAFIGDWKKAGLPTKKAYEVAKARLAKCGIAQFKGGNKGTRAILLNPTIFSITQDQRGNPEGIPTGNKRESKENPRGTKHTDHPEHTDSRRTYTTQDSNSAPVGAAFKEQESQHLTRDEVKAAARDLHESDRRSPESLFGTYPPEEIEQWATNWFLEMSSTGWMLKGSKVKYPLRLLEAYLGQCARRQAVRFNELRNSNGNPALYPEDEDEPF